MIGHTVVDGEEHRCTQAYVWDTNPSHTVHFIDQAGQETILPDVDMRLVDVEHFCCGQTGTGEETSSLSAEARSMTRLQA
jgi:hypothetical protein